LSEALLVRICRTANSDAEPRFRASGTYRFDAPDQSFGTCYVARDFKTCFLETVVRNRSLKIPRSEYDSRSVALLVLNLSELHLVPIHGDEGATLRIDHADVAGNSYEYPRALSSLIHAHADEPHGIVYRSRFDDGSLAIALFERARRHVRLMPKSRPVPLRDVGELADAVREVVPFVLQ
jgi:hypothetical protein